jgi:predicted PurR-regulated permease PerM
MAGQGAAVSSLTVVRRTRYAMVAVALLLAAWLLWQAWSGLIPFLIGALLAYILAPMVEFLARGFPFHRTRYQLARTLAIVIVYLAGFGVLFGAAAVVIPAAVNEVATFVENLPVYIERSYRERVPAEIQARVDAYLSELGTTIGGLARAAFTRTFNTVRGFAALLFGYIIIPFWLFYVLKDRHEIGPYIRNMFPAGVHRDVDYCIRVLQRVVGSYFRAQLLLGLFIGVVTSAGLYLLGIESYLVLGIIAGITELIPVIGPILGAIPAIVVSLATQPEKTLWVVLFYIAVQQVENAVLVPRIQGNAVKLHPAAIIVLLAVAQQIGGFLAMLVVVPLAAAARDLFVYIYQRLREREEELAHPRVVRLDRVPHEEPPAAIAAPPGRSADPEARPAGAGD